MNWANLLSGLIGAVVGAIASYLAARTQTSRILAADRGARIEVATRERALLLEADSRAAATEVLDALFAVQFHLPYLRQRLPAIAGSAPSEALAARAAVDDLKRAVRVTVARLDSTRLRQLVETNYTLASEYAYLGASEPAIINRAQGDVNAFLDWSLRCFHKYLDSGVDPLSGRPSIDRPQLSRQDPNTWTPPPLP